MIPTGTPARTNQPGSPSGELNSIGELHPLQSIPEIRHGKRPSHALTARSLVPATPARSPLRRRIII